MKLRQRSQQVFEAIKKGGKRSIRKIAEATGIAKSSVHRHQQAIERRNQYSESELWETAAGGQWLRLLVLGTIYIFGIKCGIGVETLSEFFYLLQLPTQVGVSPSALHKLEAEVRERILQYQQQQQSILGQNQTAIEICAAADETNFERDVLVLMDLKSGYILVEEEVENRQYQTWLDKAQTALTRVGVRVRSLVSDRAPALIKLALEGFECPSIADLFHPLWDLSKSVGAALSRQFNQATQKLVQVQKRLAQLTALAKDTTAQQQLVEQQQAQLEFVQSGQRTYHRLRQQLTLTVHPFALTDSGFKTTTEIQAQLEQLLLKLETLQNTHHLLKADSVWHKFRQQIPALAVRVNSWWQWVQHSLSLENLDASCSNWLLGQLLPTVYWQHQLGKTKSRTLRRIYRQAHCRTHSVLLAHPFTATLAEEQLQHWQDWAQRVVTQFHRASSAVEGRNGYLSSTTPCAARILAASSPSAYRYS
ncbi:MAG: hypothetical protein JO235_13065 [Chroococcidiopsidaceae cyanobacterium CP_BM_RX_35]|nr:hypothetical protein [Chroococcidiopsidaceae cyanobacterium CP_BM_RX_35]